MMKRISFNWKYVILFFAAIVAVLGPTRAFALDLRIRNDFGSSLNTVVVYYDDASNKWTTMGWYVVDARSSKNFRISTSKQDIYLYTELVGSKTTWGNGDVSRYVISESFSYRDGQNCPAGKNRRNVNFTKFTARNNILDYRPTDTSTPLQSGGGSSASNQGGSHGRRDGHSDVETISENIVNLINRDRMRAGLQPLETNDKLDKAARTRARELSEKNNASIRPDGRRYDTVLSDYRIAYAKAWASATVFKTDNAAEIYRTLYNDETYRRNIMSREFTDIGVGIYRQGNNYYCAQILCDDTRDKSIRELWKELKGSFKELRDIF